MAQSFAILQNSFKHFGQGQYKESMEELKNFKQLKEQSDQNQSMIQINENIILCEYNINKDANASIAKLDEIIDEIKKTQTQKKKTKDDDSILQYNKSVMLFLSGKTRQAHHLLKQLRDNYNLDIYLNIKVHLLLVETSFQLQEFVYASELYKKLSSEETLKSLQNKNAKPNQTDDQQQQQSQSVYTSLLLGSDLPYPDAHPNTFSKEEFLFILNVIKFRFYMLSNSKDWKKQLQNLEQSFKSYLLQLDQPIGMQQYQVPQFSQEIQPYLKLQSQMIFKLMKAQKHLSLNENVQKCIKMLNPLAEINQVNQEFFQTKQYLYLAQIYNNLGCVHAKLSKFSLATIYFHKAIAQLKNAQQTQNLYEGIILANIKQRQYALYQNLADALFMDQKYQKALSVYNQLQELCNQSPKFWYNRGVCYIQIYHESMPDKNEVYEIQEEHNQINHQEEPKKFVLQSKEIYSDADEEVQDQFYKIDQKNEENKLIQPKAIKDLLTNAIRSFRNAIILSKKDKREEQTIQLDQDSIQIQGSQILESSIVFLTYSLLCRGDYNMALQQGKEALEYNLTDSNRYTIIQYILEAYIQIQKLKDANTFLNSSSVTTFLNRFNNSNLQFLCRNIVGIQTTCFANYSPKAIYHFNLAAFHLHNNNPSQAQNSIQSMMNCCEININQASQVIPLPILNLLIWYNLKTDNIQHALHLVKRRRLLTGYMGKNKISLLNITK